MELIIDKHVIDGDIEDILRELNRRTNGYYFNNIKRDGDNITTNCPFHKDGQERKPSCYIYSKDDSPGVAYGYFKCFTCGTRGPLYKLVSYVLGLSENDARQWLVDNFSSTYLVNGFNLPEIVLPDKRANVKMFLDESILDNFNQTHPYMYKRGLTDEVIKQFKIGYNSYHKTITFPVWDKMGRLVGITERSVESKRFHIPAGMDKPAYLLNYIIKWGIREIYVCESQLNALTLWGWGYPAVALFGTGSKNQLADLTQSGVKIFHLCYDGDKAGYEGAMKFIKMMPDDRLIDIVGIPNGKDVNDLTKEQFDSLHRYDRNEFRKEG